MSDAQSPAPDGTDPRRLTNGRMLSAISTDIVKIMRESYGRGPMKAKTYVLDDLLVCVLRDGGYTPFEQTLLEAGSGERVVVLRHDFQGMVADRFRAVVEERTGRTVLAFLSQAHIEPEVTIEVFQLDAPPEGLDATQPAMANAG